MSDLTAHAYVYRTMPEVGGAVHTNSRHATAGDARGGKIPYVITSMANEFGGPIPLGPFRIIGDHSIGHGFVDPVRRHRSRGVLTQNDGPFTIGRSVTGVVIAAAMIEGIACCTSRAKTAPLRVPQEAIDCLYGCHQNSHGQGGGERP